MMPRLLTWGAKGTGNPSMMMGGTGVSWVLVRVDLEPMSRASVLSPFNLNLIASNGSKSLQESCHHSLVSQQDSSETVLSLPGS